MNKILETKRFNHDSKNQNKNFIATYLDKYIKKSPSLGGFFETQLSLYPKIKYSRETIVVVKSIGNKNKTIEFRF
jgi:hypothetical protein